MSFPNFPFEYDPLNPEQQNDFPVVTTAFEDLFPDYGLDGLDHLLSPQQNQFESPDFINMPELDVVQNIFKSGSSDQELPHIHQTFDPEVLPDVDIQPAELFFPQEQDTATNVAFSEASQFQDMVNEIALPKEPQLRLHIQQQQTSQPDHLADECGSLQGTREPQIPAQEIGSQSEEAKEDPRKKRKSNLRLRMRLHANVGSQEQMEVQSVTDSQPEDRLPQAGDLQSDQDPTLSDLFKDLFGLSADVPITNHLPSPDQFETPIQPENMPDRDVSINSLPFWKAENPSNMPDYDFLLQEKDTTNNPLAVINTNLFANEITEGAAEEVNSTSKKGRKASRKRKTNRSVHAIDMPSGFTQTSLSGDERTDAPSVDDIPPVSSSNLPEGKEPSGQQKVQTNRREKRRSRRAILSSRCENSDSEEGQEDGSDTSYVPGEASDHEASFEDCVSDLDSPKATRRNRRQAPVIETTFFNPSKDRLQEDMSASNFHDGHVTCPKCNDIFANSDSLDRHFRLVHSKPKTNGHVCTECKLTCRNAQNLRRHWNNVHTGDLKFVCDVCNARFSTKRSLSLHRTKLHPDVYKPRPKRKKKKFHECQMCDYISDQSYNVIRHFFTKHTDNVAMECLHGCGKTFKSVSNAKVHFPKCKHRPMNASVIQRVRKYCTCKEHY